MSIETNRRFIVHHQGAPAFSDSTPQATSGEEQLFFGVEDCERHNRRVICYERFGTWEYGILYAARQTYANSGLPVPREARSYMINVEVTADGVHSSMHIRGNKELHHPKENFRYRLAELEEFYDKTFSYGAEPTTW